MRGLTTFSLRNIAFIMIIMILVLLGGVESSANMEIEQYPNVNVPYLSVQIPYIGASSTQVLDDISKPLESQLITIQGLKNLYSTSATNGAHMIMEFNINTDINKAQDRVYQAINRVKLPDNAGSAKVRKLGPTSQPIYIFSVSNQTKSAADIGNMVTENIKPDLSTISGVSSVEVDGTSEKKVYVKVDPDKLNKYNLTLDKVKQALLANNVSTPTGQVTMGGKTMNVQVTHSFTSLDSIRNMNLIVVHQDNSGTKNAFNSLGEGVSQLGHSMGNLGSAIQGNTQSTALLQKELLIMNQINQVSSKMYQDEAALNQVKSNPKVASSPEGQKKVASLSKQLKQEQSSITYMQGQLKHIQDQIDKATKLSVNQLKNAANRSTPKKTTSPSGPSLSISTIPLSDIAKVTYDVEQAGTYTRLNGSPAVIVSIQPDASGNTAFIVKKVKEKLAALDLPKGYHLVTLRDQSVQINHSVHSMLREAIIGAIIASIVTMLFLRNIQTTIVAILSIPLSILSTMIVMKTMGYTLNTMTLAGIAVAIGRVVDDSIVVIENIYRKAKEAIRERQFGTAFIIESTQEVGQAITASTMTTIAVFLPMAFVPGIVGKFFAPFAWSVVIAIAFSLIIALTIVPILSKLFLSNMKPIEKQDNLLQRVYEKVLTWGLGHRLLVLGFAALILIGTLAIMPRIPVNFFPDEAVKYINVSSTLPNGTSMNETNKVAKQIEQRIKVSKQVENFNTIVHSGSISIQVTLKDHANSSAFQHYLKHATDQIGEGVATTINAVGGSPSSNSLSIIVNGPNADAIKKGVLAIEKALHPIHGIVNITSNLEEKAPQISVKVNDKKAAEHGVYPGMIAGDLHNIIRGTSLMQVDIHGKSTDLNLGLTSSDLNDVKTIASQKVTNMIGDKVTIGDIASVKRTFAPLAIQRLNQQNYNSLNVKLSANQTSEVQKTIHNKLMNMTLPHGVSYSFKGAAQEMKSGFHNLIYAILLSVVLVYLVMMLAFREAIAPLSILFSLPFIFVGVIWGIFITHESLGIPALVGILMLVGIVVTNAIVLIDKVKQNNIIYEDKHRAIIEAGKTRLRPILMTAIATVGALFPLALSTEGGLISRSLAIVVISGLTASTLLTLLIVPVSYSLLTRKRIKQ